MYELQDAQYITVWGPSNLGPSYNTNNSILVCDVKRSGKIL